MQDDTRPDATTQISRPRFTAGGTRIERSDWLPVPAPAHARTSEISLDDEIRALLSREPGSTLTVGADGWTWAPSQEQR